MIDASGIPRRKTVTHLKETQEAQRINEEQWRSARNPTMRHVQETQTQAVDALQQLSGTQLQAASTLQALAEIQGQTADTLDTLATVEAQTKATLQRLTDMLRDKGILTSADVTSINQPPAQPPTVPQ